MKIQSLLITLSISFLSLPAWTQKSITLKDCYDRAVMVNSLTGEKSDYNSVWQLKDKNLSKNWLPSFDANGSFIYNSSVVDIGTALGSIPIPGIEDAIKPLPHEQYRVTIDINQVIYDGGQTRNTRIFEKTELGINQKQTDTDLYKMRAQINNYFFSLLLLDRQKELLTNYLEVISKRIASMQSALDNEVITSSDIDVMSSEKVKLEQQLAETGIRSASFYKILSGITGIEINNSTELILPSVKDEWSDDILRHELMLFDLRKEQLGAGVKLAESKRMPKAFGFATVGYGNPPGNNFFKDEFAPYYILGAGIKWNIFDWSRVKNEKQILSLQQNIIEKRKTDMSDNLKRLLETKRAEIEGIESLLQADQELIEIRKRITSSAESQYLNGIITATELLNEMNSERQALINYEIHKVNHVMAKVEYLNISGKEIE